VPERSIHTARYFKFSHLSKIIISPWGHGELCFRDFEAMLDDCVLIKPRTDFISTLDNVLLENESYEPSEINASDLENVIRFGASG